jgi:hypothetical protein
MKKLFLIFILLLPGRGYGTELYSPSLSPKTHPKLASKLSGNPEELITVWVFFTDKGIQTQGEYLKALRSIQNLPYQGDFTDLPLFDRYLRRIESFGGRIRVRSEWLNGASVTLRKSSILQIEKLPFVREIREVTRMKRDKKVPVKQIERKGIEEEGMDEETDPVLLSFEEFDYGEGFEQVEMLNVPEAHRMGFFGSGVTIGILDSGFEVDPANLDTVHISLRHLRNHDKIIDEHDFYSGDNLIFSSSTNQGASWNADSTVDFLSALIGHHDLEARIGEIHWVYDGDIFFTANSPNTSRSDIYHLVSLDGGINWSLRDTLSNGQRFSLFPKLSVGDTTFIVWQNDSSGVPEIFLSYWVSSVTSGPYSVSLSDNTPSFTPDVTKSDSFVHVVWSDNNSAIVHNRSANPASWPGSVDTLALTSIGELVDPRVAALDSHVHVVWEYSDTIPSINSSVYYSRSTDFGATWLNTLLVDGSSPKLEIDNSGNLHLIYLDEFRFPDLNIRYKRSTNQGASWSISEDVLVLSEPYITDISLAISSSKVFVVYKRGESIFSSSYDGSSWTSPQALSSSPWDRNPLITSVGDSLYIAWSRRGDGNVSFDPLTLDTLYYNPFESPGDLDGHGTWMLSIIAGLSQGNLIGPAFASDFLLAKTERAGYEDQVEEDYWVDGLEWVTSRGAEIVSSSIAYTTWETGVDWYTYADMDGRTATSSRAASLALKKGVLIVNAASNVDPAVDPDQSIAAPPDAFNIIAVGGVDSLGNWVGPTHPDFNSYSAKGPTADGRRKPELVAIFRQIFADVTDKNGYITSIGTSGSTALVAGLAAVVKSAHPSWSAEKLRDVLLLTASIGTSPNDTIGYGIPDAVKAINFETPEVSPFEKDQLLDPYPNPYQPAIHTTGCVLPYRLLDNAISFPVMRIYTLSGELIQEFELNEKIPGRYTTPQSGAPVWDGRNEDGEEVSGGLYICVLTTGSQTDRKKIAVVR